MSKRGAKVLQMWENTYGRLSTVDRESFLQCDDLRIIERYSETMVAAAIQEHQKLRDIAGHLRSSGTPS